MFQALRDCNLPAADKSLQSFHEGEITLGTGSDTTVATLASTFFDILQSSSIEAFLAELQTTPRAPDSPILNLSAKLSNCHIFDQLSTMDIELGIAPPFACLNSHWMMPSKIRAGPTPLPPQETPLSMMNSLV
jgi:hypothetical protein